MTKLFLGVNFLPHELQGSISELREVEVNSKIEGVQYHVTQLVFKYDCRYISIN